MLTFVSPMRAFPLSCHHVESQSSPSPKTGPPIFARGVLALIARAIYIEHKAKLYPSLRNTLTESRILQSGKDPIDTRSTKCESYSLQLTLELEDCAVSTTACTPRVHTNQMFFP